MIAHAVTWESPSTGRAEVLTCKGLDVVLRSDVPFPPGCPASGTLTVDAREGAERMAHGFTLKVAGSRAVGEGDAKRWDVKGRLVSATSAVRAAFALWGG